VRAFLHERWEGGRRRGWKFQQNKRENHTLLLGKRGRKVRGDLGKNKSLLKQTNERKREGL